jgi:hypothetical protein
LVVTWEEQEYEDEDVRCESWGLNWSGGAKIGDGLALRAGGKQDWHVDVTLGGTAGAHDACRDTYIYIHGGWPVKMSWSRI